MTPRQLIDYIGWDQITYQELSNCMVRATVKKGETQITFKTTAITPTDMLMQKGKIGVILWIPKDKYYE